MNEYYVRICMYVQQREIEIYSEHFNYIKPTGGSPNRVNGVTEKKFTGIMSIIMYGFLRITSSTYTTYREFTYFSSVITRNK